MIIGGLAALLVVLLVLLGISLSSTPTPPPATATRAPIANVDLGNWLAYLRAAGLEISNEKMLNLPTKLWSASNGAELQVKADGQSGNFFFFTYPNNEAATRDTILNSRADVFQGWEIVVISNLVMATPSETPPALRTVMGSHLSSYLLAPITNYLPTATPLP
jgi:hypothetical protein